ncbi:MAG: GbsR/MarR family transcriptional regulator [Bacteroidota bacterium]
MKHEEAKQKFIQGWGSLGTNWGINRTMAQVHALLLISPTSLSTEQIMEELQISRGNANMNVRELINWGLVRKDLKPGERKEFFYAEKDIWKAAMQIIKERRKRELEPLMQVLGEIKTLDKDDDSAQAKEFTKMMGNIEDVIGKADGVLDKLSRAQDNWLMGTMMKLLK